MSANSSNAINSIQTNNIATNSTNLTQIQVIPNSNPKIELLPGEILALIFKEVRHVLGTKQLMPHHYNKILFPYLKENLYYSITLRRPFVRLHQLAFSVVNNPSLGYLVERLSIIPDPEATVVADINDDFNLNTLSSTVFYELLNSLPRLAHLSFRDTVDLAHLVLSPRFSSSSTCLRNLTHLEIVSTFGEGAEGLTGTHLDCLSGYTSLDDVFLAHVLAPVDPAQSQDQSSIRTSASITSLRLYVDVSTSGIPAVTDLLKHLPLLSKIQLSSESSSDIPALVSANEDKPRIEELTVYGNADSEGLLITDQSFIDFTSLKQLSIRGLPADQILTQISTLPLTHICLFKASEPSFSTLKSLIFPGPKQIKTLKILYLNIFDPIPTSAPCNDTDFLTQAIRSTGGYVPSPNWVLPTFSPGLSQSQAQALADIATKAGVELGGPFSRVFKVLDAHKEKLERMNKLSIEFWQNDVEV